MNFNFKYLKFKTEFNIIWQHFLNTSKIHFLWTHSILFDISQCVREHPGFSTTRSRQMWESVRLKHNLKIIFAFNVGCVKHAFPIIYMRMSLSQYYQGRSKTWRKLVIESHYYYCSYNNNNAVIDWITSFLYKKVWQIRLCWFLLWMEHLNHGR